MAICITFGTHEFTDLLKGYENTVVWCQSCRRQSARVVTKWPWFTVCWIPVVPLAIHKYKDVSCPICRFNEPLEHRQDVLAMANGQGHQQQQPPPPQQFQMGNNAPGQQGYQPQQPPAVQYK